MKGLPDRVFRLIRWFLGIVFIAYGAVKLLGGQLYYGDWVIDKKTAEGPFLVLAFFGYCRCTGAFSGFANWRRVFCCCSGGPATWARPPCFRFS